MKFSLCNRIVISVCAIIARIIPRTNIERNFETDSDTGIISSSRRIETVLILIILLISYIVITSYKISHKRTINVSHKFNHAKIF